MRNTIVVLAVLALAVPAWGDCDWTGLAGNNLWEDANNWTAGGPPNGDAPDYNAGYIKNGGLCIIGDGIEAKPYHLIFGYAETGSGENPEVRVLAGATGGGKLTTKGKLDVGLNMHEGVATFDQRGGAVDIGQGFRIGYDYSGGQAIYTITGGSLEVGKLAEIGKANIGKGTFEVTGNAAIDDISFDEGYTQYSAGELKLNFDGTAAPIQQIDVTGDVSLAGSLVITGTTSATTAITIMTYSGNLSTEFTSVTLGWDVDYGDGNNDSVTVTIPEPATMVLLGIGGIGVLIRRRKR